MKIKVTEEKIINIMFFSVFIFNYAVRERFCSIIKDINVFFFVSLFLFIYKYRKFIAKKRFLLIVALGLYVICINIIESAPFNRIIYFLIQTILPLFILSVEISFENIDIKKFLENMVNTYNKYIYLYFFIFIIDLFFDCKLSKILTNMLTCYSNEWMPDSVIGYRYHFFFAHPLSCSVLVMIYYCLNMASYKIKIRTNCSYWIFHGITAALLLSFGSKSPIIIFLIIFVLFNFSVKKIIISCTLVICLIRSGQATYIINRFIAEGTSSSGRNEALSLFLSDFVSYKNIFMGYGENLQYMILDTVGIYASGAAQEYPLICYFLSYGALFTILLYILFFGILARQMIKYKQIAFLVLLCGVFLELNLYNGLTALVDIEIVYLLFIILLSVFSKYTWDNKKEIKFNN